jgi:hypothetical protein
MSGGNSTLWRASLCSVVMAFAVLGTGCAIENGDAADADDEAVETQQDLTVNIPKPSGGLKAPKNPVLNLPANMIGTQTKSPVTNSDPIAEPEPEPWHPDGRGGSANPDDVKLGTTPDRTDDKK